MIPKTIHYCWFGDKPLPIEAQRYIQTWRELMPNYQIKEWNESNFNVNAIAYTQEAYKSRKYAFVSDYARFKILYDEGGIYFDTDVEMLQSIEDIVQKGPFMGCELSPDKKNKTIAVAPGLGLAAEPQMSFYQEMLEEYKNSHFILSNGKMNFQTVVERTTTMLMKHGLQPIADIQHVEGINIYPKSYFCPMDYDGKIHLSDTTYTIHHYAQTWRSPLHVFVRKIILSFGSTTLRNLAAKIYHWIHFN